jgi:hypothetical protein
MYEASSIKLMSSYERFLLGLFLCVPLLAMAEQPGTEALTEPSVEDSMRAMDTDHDGMVTVYELRSFIEARHGKGYKKQTLDSMEASAKGMSCGTPFAKPLY